ncbi:hypothetical protein F1C10_03920 [Sphingomonas sp. NBWT7]|uniref:hypothetical protein n=1 Tax=Sphingomonas sp. NBWT7 TaxID=2596913 RepID=UPI00162514B5|nr:hypothetical protein [Sphingomonas sp. NBWT7]QNE31169.1 hypothetical protein F1C10_03920 [Sphingomonas sp. NBWT7]
MSGEPRTVVQRKAEEQGTSLHALSLKIGRNAAYLHQWVHRRSPKRLPDNDRLHLAMALNIDERLLGARDPWSPPV